LADKCFTHSRQHPHPSPDTIVIAVCAIAGAHAASTMKLAKASFRMDVMCKSPGAPRSFLDDEDRCVKRTSRCTQPSLTCG
jgi:hypothetical protein